MANKTGIQRAVDAFDSSPSKLAEAVGGAALAEVQIGAIIAVPQPGTLATDEDLWGTRYGRHQAFTGKIVAGRLDDQVIQTGRRAA